MSDRYLYRIVTFEGYPDMGNPRNMLLSGNATITLPPKQRYYAVRQVFYDDSMTPIYAIPSPWEERYDSVETLIEHNPSRVVLKDSPILDLSNYMKVYEAERT
jgi:hypothetical protein